MVYFFDLSKIWGDELARKHPQTITDRINSLRDRPMRLGILERPMGCLDEVSSTIIQNGGQLWPL